jgi:hypothetical protein
LADEKILYFAAYGVIISFFRRFFGNTGHHIDLRGRRDARLQ